jgi:hypothetical protein
MDNVKKFPETGTTRGTGLVTTPKEAAASFGDKPARFRDAHRQVPVEIMRDEMNRVQRLAADAQMTSACNGNCVQGRLCDCVPNTEDTPPVFIEDEPRPLLTPAGWFWLPYLIGFAAIAAWAYSTWR